MSTPHPRGPAPLFGVLAPGEKRTRKFYPLPSGVMPLVQNFPNGTVRLVEQGKDFVTIENTGNKRAPFTVMFVTQEQLKKLMLVKQVVDAVSEGKKR